MTEKEIQPIAIDGKIIDFKTKEVIEDLDKGINKFKVIETITHDDRRIYELTNNDIGYYNFKGEKLLAHLICNKLNGLIEKNKVLYKEIGRLKTQNNDLLFSNANNMELLEKENQRLKQENKKLEELVIEVDNELEIRDIVCGAGKFRLEEWGKHRYHQFYKGDEELEDESIVIMLMELEKENKELKTVLNEVLDQLYSAESSLIHEYSTNITEDEKELQEHFKSKYGKYGWKE